MIISLQGFRALVCGGSQGIGLAIGKTLADAGASVTLLSRNQAKLEAALGQLTTKEGQNHRFIAGDLGQMDTVWALLETDMAVLGGYHILINNTGGPAPGPITEATEQAFLSAFQAHVLASHALAKGLVPFMKEQGYGRIINIISTSVKTPIPGLGVSNTIRAAMAGWSKTLASELAPFGITVNNVLPGFTETPRLQSLLNTRAQNAGVTVNEYANQLKSSIPARRFGQPEEVAALVGFLSSPHAGYITGTNIPVDGGNTPAF